VSNFSSLAHCAFLRFYAVDRQKVNRKWPRLPTSSSGVNVSRIKCARLRRVHLGCSTIHFFPQGKGCRPIQAEQWKGQP